jgi:hypothetical protein
MNKGNGSDSNSLQAKIVVLGDPRTGKSSVIHSLDPYCRNVNQGGFLGDETTFTVMEIPSSELENASSSVFLKFWEYSGAGPREQEVAFPGALFCIVTLDMRAPETANTAFNKWIALKEKHIPDSFLFVIGTFLDYSAQRRVDISEICKACAQKEAIYLEVSNLDGSNISLLRRLLCQRISYMLKIRDDFKKISKDRHDHISSYAEESKTSTDLALESLLPNILDQNIVGTSIGNMLSTALGTNEYWPGFENEQNNLHMIGSRISEFIDHLSDGIHSTANVDSVFPYNTNHSTGTVHTYQPSTIPEPDLDEINHLFDMMGLALPQSMQHRQQQQLEQQQTQSRNKPKKSVVKMKVRLPDNSFDYLTLRSGCNIQELVNNFIESNDMQDHNHTISSRLYDIGSNMLRKAEEEELRKFKESQSAHDHEHGTKLRKCKARIQLPSQQILETVIWENEDAMVVAKRLAEENGLSLGFQHKIWEQLQKSLDSFKNNSIRSNNGKNVENNNISNISNNVSNMNSYLDGNTDIINISGSR